MISLCSRYQILIWLNEIVKIVFFVNQIGVMKVDAVLTAKTASVRVSIVKVPFPQKTSSSITRNSELLVDKVRFENLENQPSCESGRGENGH